MMNSSIVLNAQKRYISVKNLTVNRRNMTKNIINHKKKKSIKAHRTETPSNRVGRKLDT